MATIEKFEDLEIWQMARILCQDIFKYIHVTSFSKDFKLAAQINSSSRSVMDNIAEGFERGGNKEFIQFLSTAKGSAAEVQSQLYKAFDRKYITLIEYQSSYNLAQKISKGCNGMIVYLKGTAFKGNKFKGRV